MRAEGGERLRVAGVAGERLLPGDHGAGDRERLLHRERELVAALEAVDARELAAFRREEHDRRQRGHLVALRDLALALGALRVDLDGDEVLRLA